MAKEMHPDWNIKFLILEPGGTKSQFSSSSMAKGQSHPAYTDPKMAVNQVLKYFDNPKNLENWADQTCIDMESRKLSLPEDGCRGKYNTIDMGTERFVRVHVYHCKYLRLRQGRLCRVIARKQIRLRSTTFLLLRILCCFSPAAFS
jgi:hypothetical protein